MNLRHAHVVNWFPMALAVMGSLSLVSGVFIAIFSMTVPVASWHDMNPPRHGTMYVGTNTCYSCHGDESHDWSLTLYAQTIVNPMIIPKVVVNDVQLGEQVWQINVDDMADAYTTEDTITSASNRYPQHYVIETEDGHMVHPDHWNTSDSGLEAINPDNSHFKCGTCHTNSFVPERLNLETTVLTVAVVSEIDRHRQESTKPNPSGWLFQQCAEYYVQTPDGNHRVIGSTDIHNHGIMKVVVL